MTSKISFVAGKGH